MPFVFYEHENILTTNCDALVNPVNCVGVMGKGLALQVKQLYPEVYEYYRDACALKKITIDGVLHVVDIEPTSTRCRYIVNFPTKQHYRDKSEYLYIEKGLLSVVQDVIPRFNIKSIAFPKIGCGNGGLEWEIVRPMLIKALTPVVDNNNIVVEIYQ